MWLLILSVAFASENWFCTQESSKVYENSVVSCGVGIGKDEGAARAKALANATDEFDFLCNTSQSCRDRKITLNPGRTTCDVSGGVFRCYRMVTFNLGEKIAPVAKTREIIVAKPSSYTPIGTATGGNGNYSNEDFFRDWRNTYLRKH